MIWIHVIDLDCKPFLSAHDYKNLVQNFADFFVVENVLIHGKNKIKEF